jgi:hypothetical protein
MRQIYFNKATFLLATKMGTRLNRSKVRIEGQVDEPEEIIAPENFAGQQQQ